MGLSSFCLVVTGWAALPLAWAVDRLARRDLERVTAGSMVPNGKGQEGSPGPQTRGWPPPPIGGEPSLDRCWGNRRGREGSVPKP
jgi:hypothetical protein